MKQPVFFDVEERLARLSGLGAQLEAFFRAVDFEVCRSDVAKVVVYSDGSKGGRPSFDATLRNAGYLPMSGQIMDATLVVAPK